jgi:hypothetical protein
VTSNTKTATNRQNAPLARLLAFVLLVLITVASTAGVVHKHGNLLLAASGTSAKATYSAGDTNSSANHSRSSGECVICQFRQHLSTSLLSVLPQIVAPQDQTTRSLAVALPSLSVSDTPQCGRAPPLASLI